MNAGRQASQALGAIALASRALAFALALALAACGASGGSGARTHDDRYREIQRHEATIAHSRALVLEGPPPECAPGCDAVVLAARASRAICELADEIADEDARTRCRRGSASLEELRAWRRADCVCDAAPGTGASLR